jgi:hypothetical protein
LPFMIISDSLIEFALANRDSRKGSYSKPLPVDA